MSLSRVKDRNMRKDFPNTLRTIKKVTAVLKDISGEKNDLLILFLLEMERVSSNEVNVTNPMSFHQLF